MSENQSMGADVIPAGDQGEFRITDKMMFEADAATLEAFQILLEAEAQRRNLELRLERDMRTNDVLVRWRPGP